MGADHATASARAGAAAATVGAVDTITNTDVGVGADAGADANVSSTGTVQSQDSSTAPLQLFIKVSNTHCLSHFIIYGLVDYPTPLSNICNDWIETIPS